MEHLLAKEGVAGSIPVSRLKKERYQIGIVLFFERWSGLESSMSTLRIGVLFCMHMTAGPDFTGLCLIGGAAEEEAFQCGTVKGEEGPEVTEACKGWCGNHGE